MILEYADFARAAAAFEALQTQGLEPVGTIDWLKISSSCSEPLTYSIEIPDTSSSDVIKVLGPAGLLY